MRTADARATIVVALATAAAVLLVGGALPITTDIMLALGAVGVALAMSSRREAERTSPVLGFLLFLIAVTTAQIVPLPAEVGRALNPTGSALVESSEALLGPPSSWRPLSLDPSATRGELLELVAYALLTWLALRIAATDRGRRRLLSIVALTAAAVATSATVHSLLGAQRLFGVYQPEHAHPGFMGPLLNPNHLASLLVLGALVSVGLCVHERRSPPLRLFWLAVAFGACLAAMVARSRGAMLGLGGGAVTMAVIIVMQSARAQASARRATWRVVVPATITVLCCLVVGLLIVGDDVAGELEATGTGELTAPRSKYAAWRSAWTLVEESPVIGIGRGAFQAAFTRVHPPSGQATYSHLENEYLQTLVDWGLLGVAAVLGFGALFLRVLLRRWARDPLIAGAFGGLVAVAIQSCVDFGLQLPGIAVPTLLVACTLAYPPLRTRRRAAPVARVAASVLAVGLVLAVQLAGRAPLAEDHRRLRAAASATAAREALARHPLDYVAAAQLSRLSADPAQRVRLLNHAMRLHPTHPGLHRVAARMLYRSGREEQAKLEYRLAIAEAAIPDGLVDEVAATFATAPSAAEALPFPARQWYRIYKHLTARGRDDLAIAYLDRARAQPEGRTPAVLRPLLALALRSKELGLAEQVAAELNASIPSAETALQLARVQVARGRRDAALVTLRDLSAGPVLSPAHVDARILVCDQHLEAQAWAAARDCITQALLAGGASSAQQQALQARLSTALQRLRAAPPAASPAAPSSARAPDDAAGR